MLEAERCLMCKNPTCIDGCPVRVNIPRFIDLMARGDMRAAADSLLDDNALPCVTGRVCPQETQCERRLPARQEGRPGGNRLPRALRRRLGQPATATAQVGERQHSDRQDGRRRRLRPGRLTAAGELAKRGHAVTVFEAFHAPGGVLIYGIPEFRLPKDIVHDEIDRLQVDGRQDRAQRDHRQDVHARRSCASSSTRSSSPSAPACRCS